MKAAGHRIVELDQSARREIASNTGRSTAPGLIRQLLEASDGHPGVTLVLITLERYAVNGRFYNLDLLGGHEHHDGSPRELWDELEMRIIEGNPDMLDDLASEAHDEVRIQMNRIIARSMGLWCELVYRAWVTGVCASLAQQWSPQLDLGHPEPKLR